MYQNTADPVSIHTTIDNSFYFFSEVQKQSGKRFSVEFQVSSKFFEVNSTNTTNDVEAAISTSTIDSQDHFDDVIIRRVILRAWNPD